MPRTKLIALGVSLGAAVVSFFVMISGAAGIVYGLAVLYFCLFLIAAPITLIWVFVRRLRLGSTRSPEVQPGEQSARDIESNLGALALSVGAALLGAVSVFLPALETSSFSQIEQNTLIQSGLGFLVLGCAVGIVGGVYRVYNERNTTWSIFTLGAIILGAAIYSGTGSRAELHSVGSIAGETLSVTGSPAIGLYAAGAAGCLAMLGGWILAGHNVASFEPNSTARTKACPDCAETILEAARVCKHCGHRFEPERRA